MASSKSDLSELAQQDEMDYVCENIGRGWKELARGLLLTDADVEGLELDHSGYGVSEMAHRTMVKWRCKCSEPTITKLLEVLQTMKRNDLVQKLQKDRENRNRSSSGSHVLNENGGQRVTDGDILPKHVTYVSMNVGESWREFGKELGFDSGRLDEFRSLSKAVGGLCRIIIEDWIEATQPKLKDLVDALQKIGKGDIADRILKMK